MICTSFPPMVWTPLVLPMVRRVELGKVEEGTGEWTRVGGREKAERVTAQGEDEGASLRQLQLETVRPR